MVWGEIWRDTTAYIQARSFMARNLEKQWEETPSWRRSKSGQKKKSILKTHENCEESISSTLEDTEFKETIKNAREKLETSVALGMPCKIWNIVGVVHPTKLRQNLRVFWKLMNPQGMRMGNSIPHHHEDHIAGKGENSLEHYNLVHKFIPMPQAMKIPAAKAAVDKEWEKLEKISAWNLTKVKSKKQVID